MQTATVPNLEPEYSRFDQLDGSHPLQEIVPESCVMYSTRILPRAEVAYFNYSLAKEMGLIQARHPSRMTPELRRKLIETFALRIINEWDELQGTRVPKGALKARRYMATRYLQLQHKDRNGRTSGDGRGIWNGVISHNGRTWDVSSRGTGVTRLAPGVVRSGKPLRTGNGEVGYGCGLAELDELIASTIQSGIFHANGIATERTLLVLDLGRGLGIGVRVSENLLRPAHLFPYLKQRTPGPLRRLLKHATSQIFGLSKSSNFKRPPSEAQVVMDLARRFATFAARLERDYIFAWLDWDGDNVLLQGGIIDYGSIRQFGLRHDQYRYDDVERYSTNLNEQVHKARLIVETLVQCVRFLETGRLLGRRSIGTHPAVQEFERTYQDELLRRFLAQMGIAPEQGVFILKHHRPQLEALYRTAFRLERKKRGRTKKVADGINRPPLGNLRKLTREWLVHALSDLHSKTDFPGYSAIDLAHWFWASGTPTRDRKLTTGLRRELLSFQNQLTRIHLLAMGGQVNPISLFEAVERSNRINRPDRITGDGLIHVVDELLAARRKGLQETTFQNMIDALILDQSHPGANSPGGASLAAVPDSELWTRIKELINEHCESL